MIVIVDENGLWTAAAFLRDDPTFSGTQHGMETESALCGIPREQLTIVRNPFYGNGFRDCRDCATRLHELAAGHQQ